MPRIVAPVGACVYSVPATRGVLYKIEPSMKGMRGNGGERQMKRKIILVVLLAVVCTSCGNNPGAPTSTTTDPRILFQSESETLKAAAAFWRGTLAYYAQTLIRVRDPFGPRPHDPLALAGIRVLLIEHNHAHPRT